MRPPFCPWALALYLTSACASSAPPEACPIPGDLLHWQADYCMATIGTDDVIAAGDCLDVESAAAFPDACEGKRHYKRGLCELAVRNGGYPHPVDRCMEDPQFIGPTVHNGGA